jgi:predicted nucleotidyltransferase component of viral defense system
LDYKKLFHKEEAFQRETFQKRMEEFGFKNMARMELFLWDLELFLHIQKILGDKIILKGGAATQFYLPRDAQRTSVDIDMLFFGTEEEIKKTLRKIEEYLGTEDELFYFHKHSPKNPKTNLPLHTYYTKVPSVLSNAERNMERESIPYQELKIEFILQPEKWEYERRTGENIFAVNSSWNYQILPLNYLFADKLTTLGCNTIGVQNERLDEQVKQFYDIMMLSRNCISEMQCSVVKEKYLKRAEQEWNTRKITLGSTLEGRDYEPKYIVEDVEKQLLRYQQADSGEDAELKKFINDFHSLYLNRKVQYDPKTVACGASLVRLMYELMISGMGWDKVKQALEIEKKLGMEHLSGPEKGQKIRELRNQFIQEFGKDSVIPASTLKGKDLKRVFWAIVNIDNLNKIEGMI